MKIKRKDKRVRCLQCYYEFWADVAIHKEFICCPRCLSFNVEYVKEYGRVIVEIREYDL